MLHEACRAIVSAADALRAEPLSQKGKETLAQIVRFANDAAGEIEYLQTCATTDRPKPISEIPGIYFETGLSRQRLQMLSLLYLAKGRVVTHDTLMSEMYARGRLDRRGLAKDRDMREDPSPRVLMTYVCQIRDRMDKLAAKLEAAGEPSVIETVWGVGYRLVHLSDANEKLRGRGRTSHWYRRKSVARDDVRRVPGR